MSGLAGLYYPATPKPVDPARIRAMADAQAHRGPDGSGVWTAPGVGLGHRRLAIIDLAGSPQPMSSADGALTVTCDGEIYNYIALRAELQARGAVFATTGDTEVLLHGWTLWGPAMLDRLNGEIAFALHDSRRQCLFLARDRLGVKPLHYAELSDGAVAFSSELKGLLAHPLLRREPDIRAIEDYMALGYVPDDACIVAGVRKLAAGHALLIERGKPVPAPSRWWGADFSNRATGSAKALEEELVSLLRDAVRSRMVADVPLGALLSGGVDSAAVVALMAEASSKAVKTCTVGYGRAGHDERSHAAQVARRFATDHRARVVAADDVALIDPLVTAFDEPFADASALAIYRLCELAREEMTVALSGDGADEGFAGHRRYRFQRAEERVRALLPAALRVRVFGALGRHYPKADWAPPPLRARSTLLALAEDGAEAYAHAVGVTTPALRARLFSDAAKRALGGHRAEDRYVRSMHDAPARDALDRAQYADFQHWLPGNVLAKADRTSMAVSLAARAPLLDHRLIEFAQRLPVSMRVRRGQGNWLLKQSMACYLPADIPQRGQKGFVTPISAWFRGPLAGEAAALTKSRILSNWFDPSVIATLAADHRAGHGDHGHTLWQLVMLDRATRRIFG
ncbi:asparagine synthase (glutamine-hydrolyzing) [Sphingomonas qilianensis]|uniref:asparagine synthase (glutamine-hydrolyzing) n=1 Tax=Sphingomonas qilianensis TaxID=1736690 RepID=A0ABU9XRW4_9SPHN